MYFKGFVSFLAAMALSTAGLLIPGVTSADVVFDNFDAGGGFHPENNASMANYRDDGVEVSALRSAVKFTVTGGDFTLSSITLPIVRQNNSAENLRVRITEDSSNSPGATLEILSENESIWPAFTNPFTTTTTINSTTNPMLSNGSSYWIVSEPTSAEECDYRWPHNTSGVEVTVIRQPASALPADPWPGTTTLNVPFRVEGDPPADCGNGMVEGDEECDDGNSDNTDACVAECKNATCGDGYVWDGEEACDDGDDNSDTVADACRETCVAASCGDGVVDTNEACDDANTLAGDGCDAQCSIEQAPPMDGGTDDPGSGGSGGDDGSSTAGFSGANGCAMSSGDPSQPSALWALAVLCLVAARRRRA